MSKEITVKFKSPGIQSDIYYVTAEVLSKLENKDTGGLSQIEFVEQNADREFNLSFGICLDHSEFRASILEGSEERGIEIQDISSQAWDDEWQLDQQSISYESEEFEEKDCEDPSDDHVAAVFVPVSYPEGEIECKLSVDDDFNPSDITLITKSLDVAVAFVNENIYPTLNTIDDAEREIYGLVYKGQRYEFGHSVSFRGGSGSPVLFRYDEDEDFWYTDYYTEIFDEG